MTFSDSRIIHAGSIFVAKESRSYILLRQIESFKYVWFLKCSDNEEVETPIWGGVIGEAIAAARKAWKIDDLYLLNCGFRYTLPERDEVGTNALFHQMVSSYSSSTGVYFDDEVGSNCIVHNASLEARLLSDKLLTTPFFHISSKRLGEFRAQGPRDIHP